ncbi:MAG TPA: hypothetical protein VFE46_11810 [Pirellulales bacterium]|jgi:hypothetical protein|nr:hypothetical protein [Pirellulales bacterium]
MSTNEAYEELPEELKAIEAALRQLAPQTAKLDRDRLMYLAGQASVRCSAPQTQVAGKARLRLNFRRNGWQLATAALVLVTITLGGLLLKSNQSERRVVYMDRLRAENFVAAASYPRAESFNLAQSSAGMDADYFQLRKLALTRGIDALPTTPAVSHMVVPQSTPQVLPTLRRELYEDES